MQVERLIISDERHLTPAVRPKLIDVIVLGVRYWNGQPRDVEEQANCRRVRWPGCDRSCCSSQRVHLGGLQRKLPLVNRNMILQCFQHVKSQDNVIKGRNQVKTRKEKARSTCRTLASVRCTSRGAQNHHRHSAEY